MQTNYSFQLLVVWSLLLAALPAPAVKTASVASAAPVDLLQFSAGGHVLGFTASGMYDVTDRHDLEIFLGQVSDRSSERSDPNDQPAISE